MSNARVQQARSALKADPTQAQHWVDYVQALVEEGQNEEASKVLQLGRSRGLSGDAIDKLAMQVASMTALLAIPAADPIEEPSQQDATALVGILQSGRHAQAEVLARRMVTRYPRAAFGWSALGASLAAQGRTAEAVAATQTAAKLAPEEPGEHYNLARLLIKMDRTAEAEAPLRAALRLQPDFTDALYMLAVSLQSQGRLRDAQAGFKEAIRLRPEFAEAHYNLGVLLHAQDQLHAAEASYRQAIILMPVFAQAHENLGVALQSLGRLDEAVQAFESALSLGQNNAWAHSHLGNALQKLERHRDAEAHLRKAITLAPADPINYSHLGAALCGLGRFDEARAELAKALHLDPRLIDAHINLVEPLQNMGLLDDAIASARVALQMMSDRRDGQDKLLFVLDHFPDKPAEEIYAAYQSYEQQFGAPLRGHWLPHANAPLRSSGAASSAPRRLRIGYVSPDLRQHSVRHFLEPLLARHDRSRFEVFAYAELAREDAATQRYRSCCDHFILTRGLSDEALAARIRSDAIDVLIDVAGHTAGNRLLVFARKPAPVSLSWLGYGYTTGLKAIDYLLTDEPSAPVGSEHLFSETPWRLPGTAYVYRPDPAMGAVSSLPALAHGWVTFGTLTRAIRINHRTVRVWAQILKRVPNARLVIDSKNFQHASMQEAMAARFAEHGIEPGRLLIGCHSPPWDTLRTIDIGLDCFPHNSGTTLFETLYMGVPYVTLAGRPSVGRLGRSILSGLEQPQWLQDWCATSEQDYIDKAVALACDLPALQRIRSQLRLQMQASALMDETGFARRLEQAYLQMFERWQASRTDGQDDVGKHAVPVGADPALHDADLVKALQLREAGHAESAEQLARSLCARYHGSATCFSLLGEVLHQQQRPIEALQPMRRATELAPQRADLLVKLGSMLNQTGQYAEATNLLHRVVTLAVGDAQAREELGIALAATGHHDEAHAQWVEAMRLDPSRTGAAVRLGVWLFERGHFAEAAGWLEHAIAHDPGLAKAHRVLGQIAFGAGRLADAERHLRRAVRLLPTDFDALRQLATVLASDGQMEEAEIHCRKALTIEPKSPECLSDLGNMLGAQERHEEALETSLAALRTSPGFALAHHTAAFALQELGRLDEAAEHYQHALSLNPALTSSLGNLLFVLNYHPDKPAEEIYAAYQSYEQQFGAPLRGHWLPHANAPLRSSGAASSAPRRLRIGYVSPDLRQHSVRHFLEPLLARHDRSRFEVFAYAELAREDAATQRYRSCCDHFILTRGLSDEALAARIRSDAIDVLIDVAGHTAGNRLLVFARKPAPVSLSWLGYGYTTGLKAIDYLLTDEPSAPVGSEHLFSETPWRLPGTAYVYRPDPAMGAVSSLPALAHGWVTFGTLTRAIRINHRTVRVWAQILKRVPRSRLVIDSKNFQHASMQEAMAARFAEHGIERERLLIGFHTPPWDTLRTIDIGLDCFPHNSGTTLFETLYMGVPYVTLAGRPSVGRLGRSILSGLEQPQWLQDWCATSEQDYIDKAVALASDLPALQRIRSQLRPQMQASALMDEAGFARRVEDAYLKMFALWQAQLVQEARA